MPPIELITSDVDFTNLRFILKAASTDVAGAAVPAVAIGYGMFVTNVINFIIIAFVIFMVVKAMSYLKRKEELLLTEIRDILKSK